MEINVGDYVRVEKGIGKVVYLYDNGDIEVEFANETIIFFKCNITKHSKDIIDLIETGDIVNKTLITKVDLDNERLEYEEDFGTYYIYAEDIKTILTHESFKSNAYTIEKEV